jgi:multicomponent Na+:H+ antiporter subunit B
VSRRARTRLFLASVIPLIALGAWGFAGLPAFGDFGGRYGQTIAQIAVPERTASNVVATTVFDFRAIDTLIEELILFAAAVGVLVLLRLRRRESEVEADPSEGLPVGRSDTARAVCTALVGPTLVLGLYVVAHGHLTPGGGFQGGIVLMSAALLVHLAGSRLRLGKAEPIDALDAAHGLGAAGFVLIGLGGLVLAGAYMENFVDLGTFARPWSGGTIPVSNVIVGLEVVGATLAILAELLDRRLLSGGRRG